MLTEVNKNEWSGGQKKKGRKQWAVTKYNLAGRIYIIIEKVSTAML